MITNKPEVVLPELPEPIGNKIVMTGDDYQNDYVFFTAAYTADQLRAYGQACIDTLARPADGEFVMVPRHLAEMGVTVAEEWLQLFAETTGMEKYERYNYVPAVELFRDALSNLLRTGAKPTLSAAPHQHEAFAFVNQGDSEANFIADGKHLNCPACGGSVHMDDTHPERVTSEHWISIGRAQALAEFTEQRANTRREMLNKPSSIRVDIEGVGNCDLQVRDGVAFMPAVTVADIVSKSCLVKQPAEAVAGGGSVRIFLDCEFNEFQGDLISMALVAENGSEWYASLGCENPGSWVAQHVMPIIGIEPVSNPEPHSSKRLPLVNRFSAKFQNDNRIANADEMNANAAACAAALMFLRQHGPEIAETFKETPNG